MAYVNICKKYFATVRNRTRQSELLIQRAWRQEMLLPLLFFFFVNLFSCGTTLRDRLLLLNHGKIKHEIFYIVVTEQKECDFLLVRTVYRLVQRRSAPDSTSNDNMSLMLISYRIFPFQNIIGDVLVSIKRKRRERKKRKNEKKEGAHEHNLAHSLRII